MVFYKNICFPYFFFLIISPFLLCLYFLYFYFSTLSVLFDFQFAPLSVFFKLKSAKLALPADWSTHI